MTQDEYRNRLAEYAARENRAARFGRTMGDDVDITQITGRPTDPRTSARRKAVYAMRLAGKTYDEIGVALGMKPGTAAADYSLVSRGLA